ncbi:HIT-like protein [Lactarius sanguifluus]|nr:HIT-like protein [Lactarius sanguifluus]
MTSFIIKAQASRPVPEFWRQDGECAFCQIIHHEARAFKIYEDDQVIAFLDILPLRPGHTLVVPKFHCARVSELPPEYAASVGKAISRISNALTKAVDNTALNVVCNQEYAQVVPHVRIVSLTPMCAISTPTVQVHYHIIPAPRSSTFPTGLGPGDPKQKPPPTAKYMHRMEYEARDDLDEDAATALVESIRAHL